MALRRRVTNADTHHVAEVTDVITNQLPNLRDLGRLPTFFGHTTKVGVLYRSSLPFSRDAVPRHVPHWPPTTVIDLRSDNERRGRPHPLPAVVRAYHHVELLRDADVAAGRSAATTLAEFYLGLLASAGDRIARAVAIACEGQTPVLVHCAAGKDRTGLVIAVLLRLAGVPRSVVVEDYAMTNRHMPEVLARLSSDDSPVPFATSSSYEDFLRADPSNIEAVLDHLDSSAGGVRGWLADRGVSQATMDGWIRTFVP